MCAIRSPKPKTRLSWVTTTTARSGRTAASRSSSMTVIPVSWSSAAVGSSQTSSRGSCTKARAIATRCIWPPESWLGRLRSFLPMPSAARTSPACSTARCFDQPAITRGIAAFSAAVSAGRRLYCWNTKPMFWRETWSASGRSSSSARGRRYSTSPASQSRMPAMTDSNVVLPQPDGPTIKRHLAGVNIPVDAAQRLDALLAAAEMLGQATDPHRDRPAASAPGRTSSIIDRFGCRSA